MLVYIKDEFFFVPLMDISITSKTSAHNFVTINSKKNNNHAVDIIINLCFLNVTVRFSLYNDISIEKLFSKYKRSTLKNKNSYIVYNLGKILKKALLLRDS